MPKETTGPIEVSLSEDKVEMKVDLNKMFGPNLTSDTAAREALGQAIIDKIKERTEAGDLLPGSSKKKYSDVYEKSDEFKAFNKSPDKINLTASGDMLGLLDVKKTTKDSVILGWSDPEQNAKAFNHHTGDTVPKRRFFGLTQSEIGELKQDFDDAFHPFSEITRTTGQDRILEQALSLLKGLKEKNRG